MSLRSITWSSYTDGGERNMTRSCPFCAATSAAAREGMSVLLMLSTVTSVSFLAPQSLMYFVLNQAWCAGRQRIHCRMTRVFGAVRVEHDKRKEHPSAFWAASLS